MGHMIFVVMTTIVGYMLYASMTNLMVKNYFETHDVSRERRIELMTENRHDRLNIIFRLVIWVLCAVFALGGDLLGIILSVIFTAEGLWYIWRESWFAVSRSRIAALTFLVIPFAALIMATCMKHLGIIWGIIIGFLVVLSVTAIARIAKIYREGE